jgi:alpha-L-fucosidase
MLVNTVSCGGNLLMNVGPTALGTWDQRALDALGVYKDWMELHSGAIYGCTQSAYTPPQDCRFTQSGNGLYLHIFSWPFKHVFVPELAGKVEYARFLHDGSEVLLDAVPKWQMESLQLPDATLVLTLPVRKPDVVVPVIELTLE